MSAVSGVVLLCGAGDGAPVRNQATVQIKLVRPNPTGSFVDPGLRSIPSRFFSDLQAGYTLRNSPFSRGEFRNVYPAIDMAVFGDHERLEYVFRLRPGANPDRIRLAIRGVTDLVADGSGGLVAQFRNGELFQSRPVVEYVDDKRREILLGACSVEPGGEVTLRFPPGAIHDLSAQEGLLFCAVAGGGQVGGPLHDFYVSAYEISNEDYARFLNDAQAHQDSPSGAFMYFDTDGNVWFNPAMERGRHEMFRLVGSGLVYSPAEPVGNRYSPTAMGTEGATVSNCPAAGISWFGAVKYCNWMTLVSGRGEREKCYWEGTNETDWAPVTATNWAAGVFTEVERQEWLRLKGFRLAMSGGQALVQRPSVFNEFYKAAAWNGVTNTLFGFGREICDELDAAFDGNDAKIAGYYNGINAVGRKLTRANDNYHGIFDLSGNIDEWLNDPPADGSPLYRATAGGSFRDHARPLTDGRAASAAETDGIRGFRIVTTYMPEKAVYAHLLYTFFIEPSLPVAMEEKKVPETGEEIQKDIVLQDDREVTKLEMDIREPGSESKQDGLAFSTPPVETPVTAPTGGVAVVYRLRVNSTGSGSDVDIDATPSDMEGRGDGETGFERHYAGGTRVTLTAPEVVGKRVFLYWEGPGGSRVSAGTMTVVMSDNMVWTAVYGLAELTVASRNPNAHVEIEVTRDHEGNASGRTLFVRRYEVGDNVTLTAPATVGLNRFQRWDSEGGGREGTNTTITIRIERHQRMTAVYESPLTLTVASDNPNSGVSMYATADIQGNGNGSTEFSRLYYKGDAVTLTAPARVGVNRFIRWVSSDGRHDSTNLSVSFFMAGDLRMTAMYESPFALTIGSFDPDSGVDIEATSDLQGDGAGKTEFTRLYYAGDVATLVAATNAGFNRFRRWISGDGLHDTTDRTVSITITNNLRMTAYYERPITLAVNSQDPDSGVTINATTDVYANGSGDTAFRRYYFAGSTVTLEAPLTAPGGNYFKTWLSEDGLHDTTSMVVTLTLPTNYTMTALYAPPPQLTIDSWNLMAAIPNVRIFISPLGISESVGYDDTPFTWTFPPNTMVSLTAVPEADGLSFHRWLKDGAFQTWSSNTTVWLGWTNVAMRAMYWPRTLSVRSSAPAAGVQITADQPDVVTGLFGGPTPYDRLYDNGTTVTLVAPTNAGQNVFSKWQLNDVDYGTNVTASVLMNRDHIITAVYVYLPGPIPDPDPSPSGL